ncbi:MAG: CoA pyrophosphatase [Syntrophorhabdus sp.]|nr:CoA pyrophosphatase [Syntrophorhabdus sp.]
MLETIRDRLLTHRPRQIPSDPSLRAATALLLFQRDGDVHCVLTKRTDTVRHHKGEVSFPGGMFEATDRDLEHTAFREVEEEIGVQFGDVEVIGRLDDSWTYSGFVISPFVGVMPYPYEFSTNPREVAYLIFLPYSILKGEEFAPQRRSGEWTSFHYNGDRIWGATCRTLMTFRDIVDNEKL